jgi:hypothetical protein
MRIYRPKITKEYIIWIDLNFFHRWTFEVFTNFEDLAVLFFTFMIIFFLRVHSYLPPPGAPGGLWGGGGGGGLGGCRKVGDPGSMGGSGRQKIE